MPPPTRASLTDSSYVYDALGRTTALPGTQIGYYANDLAYQQTANGQRQTWQLDANQRFRSWTVEENTAGTVLQLTTIHGDVALQLPLDTADAPWSWTATSTATPAPASPPPATPGSAASSGRVRP